MFCELTLSLNLVQLINEATHTHGNCLDLVLSTNPDIVLHLKVDPITCATKSDHYLITFNIPQHPTHHKTQRPQNKFIYSKANLTRLSATLAISLRDISPTDYSSVHKLWPHMKKKISEACNQHIPTVRITSKSLPRWFTPQIRHKIKCTRTLRHSISCKPTSHKLAKLAQLERDLDHLIQTSKRSYESELIRSHHHNPKNLFHHLKSLSNSKSSIPIITHNSQVIHNPTEKATIFNNFFNSIFTRSTFTLPPLNQLPSPTNQLHTITMDESDILLVLSNLDPSKSPGCDDLSPYILKECAASLITSTTKLFEMSLQTSSLPDEWKTHKIIPILKGGDPSTVSNYRPISLLCILSKVLEAVIFNNLIDFIWPQINTNQFGFLRNRSCLTQLLTSYSEVYTSLDAGISSDIAYFDFRKAFDTVPHAELLLKLWMSGITGPLWFWFKEYLSNRSHYVSLCGDSSHLLPVQSGVPQGSILGPILFLIYINDLPNTIAHSSSYLFADDTKFIKSITRFNDSSLLQSDIDSLSAWCQKWNLSLNQDKCAVMRISLKPSDDPPSYSINNTNIKVNNSQRDLGILVSNNLSWNPHYSHICANAYRALNFIRRHIPISAPQDLKKQLYISLVRSKLTYCSQLWRPRHIKDIISIESVQRRSTRFIIPYSTLNYKERLTQLNLFPIMYWFEIQDILYLIKRLQCPDDLSIYNHVHFASSNTRFGTKSKLRYNHTRTSICRHFFFNRIVKLWNSLPHINLDLPFNAIKHLIIKFMWDQFTTNFDPSNTCTFHFVCPCSQCQLLHL